MKERFDKLLSKKIKDAFDSHEEPFDPSAWEGFSDAYFGRARKSPAAWMYWVTGIAASLILVVVLWNPFRSSAPFEENMETLTYQEEGNNDSLEPAAKSPDGQVKSEDEQSTEAAGIAEGTSLSNTDKNSGNEAIVSIRGSYVMERVGTSQNVDIQRSLAIEREAPEATRSKDKMGSFVTETQLQPLLELSKNLDILPIKDAQQYIDAWLSAGIEEQAEITSETKQPIKLGVLMAPQAISNSTQSVNFGAGFMSEIPLSRRLKLDVGVGFARQQLSPQNSNDGVVFMNESLDARNSNTSTLAGNYLNSTSELSFGQLEIPVNLKYSILQRKSSGLYLVSGLANMFFVNQEKTTTFNTVTFGPNLMNQGVQMLNSTSVSETPPNTEGQVDIGHLVNLGVGFEQNLKNGTSISFEPFYKFTVDDQTFANQRFAIGGINIRMNFTIKNKYDQ